MTAQMIKIAVSIPKKEFLAVERLRRELKTSRSAVIAEAIRHWLRAHQQETEDVQRYIEGYQSYPETEEEYSGFEHIACQALAHEPWEEG